MHPHRLFPLSLAILCGCYVYVPARAGVRSGEQVEVFLSDQGRIDLRDAVGAGTRAIAGRLLDPGDSALVLSVDSTRTIDGAQYRWNGERVRIPRASFDSLRIRRVSVLRSAALAGGIAGAALLVRAGLGAVSNGGGNRSPVPSPQ